MPIDLVDIELEQNLWPPRVAAEGRVKMTTRQQKKSHPWVVPATVIGSLLIVLVGSFYLISTRRDIDMARIAATQSTSTTTAPSTSLGGEVCTFTECELRELLDREFENDSCDLTAEEIVYILKAFFHESPEDLLKMVNGEYGFEASLHLEGCLDAYVIGEGEREPAVTTTVPVTVTTVIYVTVPTSPTTTVPGATTTTTRPKVQCNDEIDNDLDGFTDFGEDPGCSSRRDDDEYNATTSTTTTQPPVTTTVPPTTTTVPASHVLTISVTPEIDEDWVGTNGEACFNLTAVVTDTNPEHQLEVNWSSGHRGLTARVCLAIGNGQLITATVTDGHGASAADGASLTVKERPPGG
ncbi:MAG: hypothetical protein NUV96_01430 [Candidatus Colwellbacteria bacterium]|nr:hypothetical protein [Candidatus Colwellbacteria bacterium]